MLYVIQKLPHTFWRGKPSSIGLLCHMLKMTTVCLTVVKGSFNFSVLHINH